MNVSLNESQINLEDRNGFQQYRANQDYGNQDDPYSAFYQSQQRSPQQIYPTIDESGTGYANQPIQSNIRNNPRSIYQFQEG